MSGTFLLPDLGEGLTEAEIVRWMVKEGDVVEVDQPVAEVETAKAVVEVPVPYAGRVTRLHAAEGAVVDVGSPLITVADPSAAAQDGEPGAGAPGFKEPGVVTAASDAAGGGTGPDGEAAEQASGNVLVGYGTAAPSRRRTRRRSGAPASRTPASPAPAPRTPASSTP
uniref:biotin/lipoyl-containing protein n=1 Tax=Nonomuraea lactucae TaxID=2249762 RepID=UPI0030842205